MKQYPSEQTVTINCDASFHPQTQRGGWACWISSKGICIQRFGTFREPVANSNDAEAKSVCNAFYYLERLLKDKNIRMIYINCDNKTVRTIITKREVNHSCRSASQALLNYVHKYECVVALTIRGHQEGKTPRQYVNNWCDTHSRCYLKTKAYAN